MNKVWTQQEIEYLEANAGIFTDEKLTQEMNTLFNRNFTIASVRKARQRRGIKKEAHRSFFRLKLNEPLG